MTRIPAAAMKKYRGLIAGVLLAAILLAVYWPVGGYDFIALDDNLYLLDNPHVRRGITPENLLWAATTLDATNWHPLTWLSLLADYEFFGLDAGGYHVTNLILHLLNTLLLYFTLWRMTGEIGKCAAVAALFAVHPLNIESVVWIAERKNLLSTLFWILTILAYVRYTEKPGWERYGQVILFFALGLMAKPMGVMLPLVLLLIDYWPLQRFALPGHDPHGTIGGREIRRIPLIRLVWEKVPLLTLALLSAFVTFYAARAGGAVKAVTLFPLLGRIENAFISYTVYLVQTIWPADLAIFYPYPFGRPVWQVLLSLLFLVAVTGFVCLKGRACRYLVTGWFWYLLTLLPVIGIVQVGFQSMANRYAYISLLGIFMIVAWGIPDLLGRFEGRRYLPAVTMTVVLALAFCTKAVLPDWKNSEAVFRQALNVTKNNHIAEMGMGNVSLGRGELPKARSHYLTALRIKPDYAEAHNNLALVLMREGRMDEAVVQLREALQDKPDYAEAYNNLGVIFAGQNRLRDAERSFRRACELNRDYAEAQTNLAKLLREEGRSEEALDHFRTALSIDPDDPDSQKGLADILKQRAATRNGQGQK